jgi:hypothetical protein
MKNQIKIKLDTIDKVKSFVNAMQTIPFPVAASSGRYVVDAKSIMGIFSLDLGSAVSLYVDLPDEKIKTEVEELFEVVRSYVCG